ncbi:MAG: patatin-like phospholipase family protein [Gammaproteobacteria bacterium]|nr:patatin-like phospholipase family protein [Gammaproteobacteria bacterium]
MTPGQEQALGELRSVEAARQGAIRVLSVNEKDNDVVVGLTVDCRGTEHASGGITIRARERFRVRIRPGFPFQPASVESNHTRWKGTPHVQWGSVLCLYQSTEAEWNPSDGMYGFLQRLLAWLSAAAKGELDPIGAAVHPPVTYVVSGTPMFVPRIDTPAVSDGPWIGLAFLERRGDQRYDIVEWKALDSLTADDFKRTPFGVAVLLGTPMPMEYPIFLLSLLNELIAAQVSIDNFIRLLSIFKDYSDSEHMHVVVGTPMRGIAGEARHQHLSVWRIDGDSIDSFWASLPRDDDSPELSISRNKLFGALPNWAEVARVDWCPVREARPEVTRGRDENSPIEWWKGKTVEVWGCGALGGTIAEHLCRAEVGRLVLRDNSRVAPGVLGRQNYEDEDIGEAKAAALAARLRRIRPNLNVVSEWTDLAVNPAAGTDWSNGADVVFDVTASPTVSKRLEMLRLGRRTSASLVAMMIGHQARNGLIVTTRPQATGGPADAVRKAKLTAARKPHLRQYAEEFWPEEPRSDLFFPEPGCSDPTFSGSGAEVTSLASTMFLTATDQLAGARTDMTATFVSLPSTETPVSSVTLSFQPDIVLQDAFGGYEVRIDASASNEMRAWVRRSERLAPGAETGGLLFGERDDALRVLWVSDLLGPPPDSRASSQGFICGTAGVDEATAAIRHRSRGGSRPIGMWHTHPNSAPVPSSTDIDGMSQVISATDRPLPKQLLVIVGGASPKHKVGAFLYDRYQPLPCMTVSHPVQLPVPSKPNHKIGVALSGGGFRAVAFHLGVLRALHDRGVLAHVDVLSTVSGGSLIGAMWAYSDDDFATFDRKVIDLLRSGLNWKIARRMFASKRTPQILASTITSVVGTIVAIIGTTARRIHRLIGCPRTKAEPLQRRWMNRTTAVGDVIARIVGDSPISEPKRGLHVILNACDLRSGSAFRFGSVESGCSRYGRLADNTVPVSLAVAASAAYPVALPALDVRWDFIERDGLITAQRLLLTDGGVFDNLGTSCLEPGRNPDHSTNVHPVDYIISADAGRGVLDANQYPLWWTTRMKRSFESVYRKVQDTGKRLIYRHGEMGNLEGFVLPFLGQQDDRLDMIVPPDLVRREDVIDYPTNFSKMPDDDIERISRRGEQLTRMMIETHVPGIV